MGYGAPQSQSGLEEARISLNERYCSPVSDTPEGPQSWFDLLAPELRPEFARLTLDFMRLGKDIKETTQLSAMEQGARDGISVERSVPYFTGQASHAERAAGLYSEMSATCARMAEIISTLE